MSIQWYPGHMFKANKEMIEILPKVDLIIELLDARIPYSSENPAIAKLKQNKPCIKILSKSDLADPIITAQWQAYFELDQSVKTIATTLKQSDKVQKITELCHKLVPGRNDSSKDILVMITGIPNVGKSTLINDLAGRMIAKTGDEPAITKGQQRIRLDNHITLIDTPGILWPKIYNINSSYRLAATGAIKDTAMDYDDVAFFTVYFLLENYPELIKQRYQLDELPESELEFLKILGAKRGCLVSGGRVDLERVSTILLNEFRSGALGRITLECPAVVELEKIEVEQVIIEHAEQKELKKNKKKKKRKR